MVRARPLMGTLFEIEGKSEVMASAFDLAERLESALSKFNPDSVVYKQNLITDEFRPLFDLARRLQTESDRAFEFERDGHIDLSGIAKGWIVDRVAERMHKGGDEVMVNGGGDLRWIGGEPKKVVLRAAKILRPILLKRAALASSMAASEHPSTAYHKNLRQGLSPDDLVCAMAGECAVADAFTKIFMFAETAEVLALAKSWGVQGLVLNSDGEVKEMWPSYEALSTL